MCMFTWVQAWGPGSGTDCVCTGGLRARTTTGSICCTCGSGSSVPFHAVWCAPEMSRDPEMSTHSSSWHTCKPEKQENNVDTEHRDEWMKEGNILFNDALNTFYLRLYGIRHMVKDHSDSERGNPLPPHGLRFPISSKCSFICTIPQTG